METADATATPTESPAPATPTPAPLDIATLLRRVNARLALLRTWLSHDHGDAIFWWARHTTAPQAQSERCHLRGVANLLHVERATRRGRIHSTQFPTLDKQKEWLTHWEERWCSSAARYAGLPDDATLVLLRQGKLPL